MSSGHQAIYKLAAQDLGVAPMRCVVVEDTGIGAQAGAAASMKAASNLKMEPFVVNHCMVSIRFDLRSLAHVPAVEPCR